MELNPSEIDLLLAAARGAMGRVDRRLTRAVTSGKIDWDIVLAAAGRHGLKPLLFRHLEEMRPGNEPAAFTERLERDCRELARRNLWLAAELVRIMRLLEAQGISAVAWKGPALAAYLYGDVALRQMDDLDIIVRRSDVPRCIEVLENAGFAPTPRITPAKLRVAFRSECALFFMLPSSRLFVELHWDIVPPCFGFSCRLEDFWPRIEHVELGGARVPVPGAEDLLLCLSVSAAKEMWRRFEWVTAVAVLCTSGRQIDWTRLMARAREQGVERMLLVGLYLARQWLEADYPDAVLARLRSDRPTRRLGKRIGGLLFQRSAPAAGWLPLTRFRLGVRERLSDRIRYGFFRAVTQSCRDVEGLGVPWIPLPLYYVFRPIRLLFQVPGALRRAIARRSQPS